MSGMGCYAMLKKRRKRKEMGRREIDGGGKEMVGVGRNQRWEGDGRVGDLSSSPPTIERDLDKDTKARRSQDMIDRGN